MQTAIYQRVLTVASMMVCFGLPIVAMDGVIDAYSPMRAVMEHKPTTVLSILVLCLLLSFLMYQWLLGSEWVRESTALMVSAAAAVLDLVAVLALGILFLG